MSAHLSNSIDIHSFHSAVGYLMLIILFCTCQSCSTTPESNVDYVARVGPYSLSRERVEQPYVHQNKSSVDSVNAVKHYIEQWAVDKAFEIEAMERLESRDELDQLIENYRSSLLTHLFEKQIIEQKLDSAISKQELLAYYEDNKSQFVLKSSILRLNFINIKKKHPAEDRILDLWKRHDEKSALDSLIALCHDVANVFLLQDSSWYKMEEVETIIPGNFLKNNSNGQIREQIFSNDTAKYFLRVLDRIPDTEIAPLSFIEKQARKVILYQRKQKLISAWRERIYRDAIKANRIKLYE